MNYRVYVEGNVEGRPVVFTADTGASGTILSSRVFDTSDAGKRPILSNSARLKGAGGASFKFLARVCWR